MSEQEIKTSAAIDDSGLRELVADYENQMNEIAELVSRVRHEINNPLTGILGQAQLLLREDLNDKARKRAEIIEELARRMTDIVAELRLVQRPHRASGRINQLPNFTE